MTTGDEGAAAPPVGPAPVVVDGDTALARAVAARGLDRGPHDGAPLVFIDHATDAETAGALARHRVLAPDATIVAQIRDARLRRAIRDNLQADGDGARVLLFGVASTLARAVIGRERLYDQACWRDQPRVHAVVIGFGALGQACMTEAVFAGIAGDLAPPRVTILDPNPDGVRARIARDMPELGPSAEIAAVDPSWSLDAAVMAAEEASPLTAILLCRDDDASQADALVDLDRLQRTARRGLAPVFALSENRSPLAEFVRPRGRLHDMARRFVVDGGWPGPVETALAAAAESDVAARRLHEAYRKAFGGVGASNAPWETLPESFRTANRRAARHLPQKLWTAGMTWGGRTVDTGAVVPEAHAAIVDPCVKSTGEDGPMRRLARLEHDRWCADRRLDGWSYGGERDDARRRHPSLIPFDDPRLTDHEISKDIDQIRFLFGAVVRPSADGATAPLVIGVVARPGAAGGIDVPGALKLSAAESWRPVVVLSALADEVEVAAVAALVTGLRAAGRTLRLRIVEAQFGEQVERRLGAEHVAAARGGLADDEVSIVPIRAGDPAADGWTDPGVEAEASETLAGYVTRRAGAVVVAGPRDAGRPASAGAERDVDPATARTQTDPPPS